MNQERWTVVDQYLTKLFIADDSGLEGALAANATAGLPAIDVAPNQGKLLHFLVKMQGARSVLEIGTLGGYSTIWLAKALPEGGRLVTLESEATHADVARSNIDRAGYSKIVEVRVGLASESLEALIEGKFEPFDFIFIDADKPSTPDYFQLAMKLSRPGTVIVVDNVIRDGEIVNSESVDPKVQGIQQFNELVASDSRVTATAIQTVGCKGYDGFAVLIVN